MSKNRTVKVPQNPTDIKEMLQAGQDIGQIVGEDLKILIPIFKEPTPAAPSHPSPQKPTPTTPSHPQKPAEGGIRRDRWITEPIDVQNIYLPPDQQVSDTALPTSDLRANLIKYYWDEGRTSTQIMYLLGYQSEKDVIDDLQHYKIPLRSPDAIKTETEILYQYDEETYIKGAHLDTDGQEIISEAWNVETFRQMNIFLKLIKNGTPSYSYMKIGLQYSFGKVDWFDVADPPYNAMYESNETIPTAWTKIGYVYGKYVRLKFDVYEGVTLDTDNYFIIDTLKLIGM